jgi:hypothetical protein
MSQVQGRETASGPTPPLIDDERAELVLSVALDEEGGGRWRR